MFARRLALAIGLLCGLAGTQGPEFSQQYRQRLGGALDELKRIVATFDAEAESRSLTPAAAIARLEGNGDPLARERGADIESDLAREQRLERQLAAMQNAGPLKRIIVMASDFDPATAAETIANFEPAVPVTSESFIVGGLALALGWSGTHLCAWPIRRRLRLRRAAGGQPV
jgi:DUF2937 family protein